MVGKEKRGRGLSRFVVLAALLASVLVPATASAAVSFQPQSQNAAGTEPASVASADLNGDGRPDLAVANETSDNVSILLAAGPGLFAPAVNYPAGDGPVSIAIADLNADGRPDLATANFNSNNVSVMLATGAIGTFAPAVNYSAGTGPRSVAIADLSNDGRPDLAVANSTSNNVSVLLASGAQGTFAPATSFAAGAGARMVAIGDLNADGRPDLAVAGAAAVYVLLASGTQGSFAAPATFALPGGASGARSIVIADLDADGRVDLATANFNSDNVTLFYAEGAQGSFNALVNYPVGDGPSSIATGDVNADGRPDLAIANLFSNNVSLLLSVLEVSPGDPIVFDFAVNFAAGTGSRSVAISDLNVDGRLDLATANQGSNSASVLLNSSQPASDLSETSLGFGPVDVGSESPSQTLTVTNSGDARLRIDDVRVTGANPGDFEVRFDLCFSDETLLVGQSCQVGVRFAPTAAGPRMASLRIVSNAPNSPQTIALTGTGTTPVPPDTTAPEVAITSGPGLTNDPTPSFTFTADEAATFRCRTDGGLFAPCASGFTVPSQGDGSHLFEVKGTDAAGNAGSATRTFVVDTSAPRPAITSGPTEGQKVMTKKPTAKVTFAFSAGDDVALECQLDAGSFVACEDSVLYPSVSVGTHTFSLRATDAAGNVRTVTRTFKVVRKR